MKNPNDKDQKIIDEIDRAITELVYEKTQIMKAYNYYHGKRDPEQFRHLEENYGIGTPTSVEFVPLVRKHIDVLIGEYLSIPKLPKISCKDKKTLSNINRDKQLKINNAVINELKKHLNNIIYNTVSNQQGSDTVIQQSLTDIQESLSRNFISEYEEAGQNIIEYLLQSRNIDLINKLKILITDLLVSATCYYKVTPSGSKTNIDVEILNPIHTFIDRNPNSPYLKDSSRAVVRKYMTKQQIIAKYGTDLKDKLEELEKLDTYSVDSAATTYVRSMNTTVSGSITSDGILGGFEVSPLLPFERSTSRFFRLFPVYEVEWLQTDKEDGNFITNRYEGIRIGAQIYIPKGKSEHIIRSSDDPFKCTLSVNGMFYSDRNGDPYSLVLKTANLQDKFDILNFYRDNLIATSGTVGDWIDLAHLPKVLGHDLTERLMKWEGYAKGGKKLYDSSQEGQMLNTTFQGFDDTVKLQAIQAIDLAIQRVEETCSTITGVFREKLGGVEQRDAVTNVQVGITQSSYITKQYYQIMDLVTREILIDSINMAKIVFKKGISGTIVLGDKLNKIFTALPEHFTFTDYDIHIADSAEMVKEQKTIEQITMEFVKGGIVAPEIILETITAKGLSRMKEDVLKAIDKKKKEMDQTNQLGQQVQQLDGQLKQVSSEYQKLQQEVQRLNSEKLQLEKEKLQLDKDLGWFKAKSADSFNKAKLSNEEKRVQLEGLQLIDNNENNNEIKND